MVPCNVATTFSAFLDHAMRLRAEHIAMCRCAQVRKRPYGSADRSRRFEQGPLAIKMLDGRAARPARYEGGDYLGGSAIHATQLQHRVPGVVSHTLPRAARAHRRTAAH